MITVEFEQVGRNRDVPTLEIEGINASDGDGIAACIHKYVGRFLASRDFDVTVYGDGTGSIDYERYGTFTWKEHDQ